MSDWVSALSGLVGVALGSGLTQMREYRAQRKRETKDAAYLVVLVAGALDRFSAGCVRVVGDAGLYRGQPDERGWRVVQVDAPTFQAELFAVDWKSLPATLMYSILDLPYRIEMARERIHNVGEYEAMPPDFEEFFEQRQFEYATLGLEAAGLAAALRKHAGFPERPAGHWDPVAYMEEHRSRIEAARTERASRSVMPLGEHFGEGAGGVTKSKPLTGRGLVR